MSYHTKMRRVQVIVIFCLNVLETVLAILFAYISKNVIDKVFINKDMIYLGEILKLLLPSYAIYFFIEFVNFYYSSLFKINNEFNIKRSFFDSIQNILPKHLKGISSMDLYYRMFSDGATIGEYYYIINITIPFNIIYLIIVSMVMMNWSRLLFLYVLLLIFCELIIIGFSRNYIKIILEKQKEIDQRLVNKVLEEINLLSFTQIYNLRSYNKDIIKDEFEYSKKQTFINFFKTSIFNQISTILKQFWNVGFLLISSYLILTSKISIGVFVGFQTLLSYMIDPLYVLIDSIIAYQNNIVSFKRFIEYFELPKIQKYNEGKRLNFNSDITINNLYFGYNTDLDIIKGLNLTLKKGSIVAIKGRSGAGKTTLMNIFMRIYDTYRGSIKIDDIDIRDIYYDSYMENFGFLEQNPIIINTTIRNNLTLYKNITEDTIITILEQLDLGIIIDRLNDNISHCKIKDDLTLSVGEIQRLALARLILKNSKILYLDEPTSNIDKESEQIILKFLKEYVKNTNSLIVINSHSEEVFGIADYVYTL